MLQLPKDPTNHYQKQLLQTIQKCTSIIHKGQVKYLTQMKPIARRLEALIKTHKPNNPIRPVINNIGAPSYKLAKFLNNRLHHLINLPYTYTVKNSTELAQELVQLHISNQQRLATLDIKDLYVNVPTQDILEIKKFWLHMNHNPQPIIEQVNAHMENVLNQNYFQHNGQYYRPTRGISTGSSLSSTATELYLQFFEEHIVKHWLETKEIIYYRRYVDDILLMFDQQRTDIHTINSHMNNLRPDLDFTPTFEEQNTIKYLDLVIHRGAHHLQLEIYRKPTQTDTTMHFSSIHPLNQKLAAYSLYIDRMLTLPITHQARSQEWNVICTTAQNNGFPLQLIYNLRSQIVKKHATHNRNSNSNNRTWATFTYCSPLVYKVTNLFRNMQHTTEIRTLITEHGPLLHTVVH
jgi:hypothetical protein